jgi:hypothetical protein
MQVTKEICEKLMLMKGEIRGVTLLTDVTFLKNEGGDDAVSQVEEKAKSFGFPLQYTTIEKTKWYPLGKRFLSFLFVANHFNFDEATIRRMGHNSPKANVLLKLSLKYFISFEHLLEKTPRLWQEHYTVGRLEVVEKNITEGTATLHLYDFNFHDIDAEVMRLYTECYLEGYIERTVQFVKPEFHAVMKALIDTNGTTFYEFKPA